MAFGKRTDLRVTSALGKRTDLILGGDHNSFRHHPGPVPQDLCRLQRGFLCHALRGQIKDLARLFLSHADQGRVQRGKRLSDPCRCFKEDHLTVFDRPVDTSGHGTLTGTEIRKRKGQRGKALIPFFSPLALKTDPGFVQPDDFVPEADDFRFFEIFLQIEYFFCLDMDIGDPDPDLLFLPVFKVQIGIALCLCQMKRIGGKIDLGKIPCRRLDLIDHTNPV